MNGIPKTDFATKMFKCIYRLMYHLGVTLLKSGKYLDLILTAKYTKYVKRRYGVWQSYEDVELGFVGKKSDINISKSFIFLVI